MKKIKVERVKIDNARIINACRAYSKWKELNYIVQQESTRGINMPDVISEIMGCWCYDFLWNRGDEPGDAYDPETDRKIEFKATSRFEGDLSSFGPETTFDNLMFLRFDTSRDLLYIYDLHINSTEFEAYPANKTQTIGEQKRQKRRPHVSLLDLFVTPKALEPDVVFDIVAREITIDNRS